MKIKRLDITGFKSFADHIVVNFDNGVTGVVGPNGCGKSNIVDALRWVMGEQNAKHLRGGQMQDIIFNGAQGRGPMGYAQVSLLLENDNKYCSPEYAHFSEIEVTRRLYRTGESEYEINKRPCRLKDITDLFLGTGVGTKAYSIIEQGRVSGIIAAKPEEKRTIIEEAAGITKYKAKRAAAERKMEMTRHNLERVSDVKRELEGRLDTLEKQAKKAQRYHELHAELKQLEFHNTSLKYFEKTAILRHLIGQKLEQEAFVEKEQVCIYEQENSIQTERAGLTDQEKALSVLQGLLYEAENRMALSRQDVSFLSEQLDSSVRQLTHINDEQKRLDQRKSSIFGEREAYIGEKAKIDATLTSQQTELEAATTELTSSQLSRDEENNRLNALQQKVTQLTTTAAMSQARIQAIHKQRSDTEAKQKQIGHEQGTIQAQLVQFDAKRETLLKELDASKSRREQVEQEVTQKQVELDTVAKTLEQANQQKNAVRDELSQKQNRLKSLEEIEARHDWNNQGVAHLMNKSAQSMLGLVADCFEAPKHLEHVIENALHHMLETILVSSPEKALELASVLAQSGKGRARFVVESALTPLANQVGFGSPLLPELKILKHNQLIETLLGRFVLVPNDDIGITNWNDARAQHVVIVSEQSTIFYPDGSLDGGAAHKSGSVLSRKREIRELKTACETLVKQLQALETDVQQYLQNKNALQAQVEKLKQERQELAISLARLDGTIASHAAEQKRLDDKLQASQNTLQELEAFLGSSQDELSNLNTAWAQALDEHKSLEDELNRFREMILQLNQDVAQKNERATTLRVQVASALERQRNLQTASEQAQKNIEDIDAQLVHLKNQHDDLIAKQTNWTTGREAATQKIEDARVEKEKLTTELGEKRAAYDTRVQALREIEGKISQKRRELDEIKGKLSALSLSIQEHELAIAALNDRLLEKYRMRVYDILHDHHLLEMPPFDLDKKIGELSRSISNLGAINPNAVQEYEENNTRYTFLKTQSEDLGNALSQLESAIEKINETTKQRFEEAFNAINERFSQVFPRLFRGGKAWLQLTNPGDLLNSGVEIFAQPPGKKLGSIVLMSGGEKALTAISLIFAIFLIKPSPFCLLDEVDAPLDEANVDRFSFLVKEMSAISQFIVITHNKRTMEVVDQLYGVTMEQPGVSKTVNVRVTRNEPKQETFELIEAAET